MSFDMDPEQQFKLELFQDLRAIGCVAKWGAKLGDAAIFDEGMKYRYQLYRRWREGPSVQFCMLNASTADENQDDPTVRRCMGFAKHWGFSGIEVSNLFAWRTMDPSDLALCDDPIGRLNDDFIVAATKRTAITIVAWGNWGAIGARFVDVLELIKLWKGQRMYPYQNVYHLGLTGEGQPKHPLYLRKDTARQKWSWK